MSERDGKIEKAARAFLDAMRPIIRFSYNPSGPDTWECVACDCEVDVVYSPRGSGLMLPCDEANFPHADDCPAVSLEAALAASAAAERGRGR